MVNGFGGARSNAGRPLDSLNKKTVQLIRTIREIVAEHNGDYERAVLMLLADAADEQTKVRDRLAIINFFAERIEGKAVEHVEVTSNVESVASVLSKFNNRAAGGAPGQPTEAFSDDL